MPGYLPAPIPGNSYTGGWGPSDAGRLASATGQHFVNSLQDLLSFLKLPGDTLSGAQPTMAFDPNTGVVGPDPQLTDRAAGLAGMLTLGAGAMPAEANALNMGIKAYHGSPHNFDQFDLSKIGTGEGAQVYGHGLYFAENEAVALGYHDRLAPKLQPKDLPNDVKNAIKGLDNLGFDTPGQAIREIRADQRSGRNWRETWDIQPQDEAQASIIDRHINNDRPLPKGTMYEVDINAHPDQFLQWDRPITDQPEPLRNLLSAKSDPEFRMSGAGQDMHNKLVSANRDPRLPASYRAKAEEKVSSELALAGIPGIRYLDQGSRGDNSKWNLHWRGDSGSNGTNVFSSESEAKVAMKEYERRGFKVAMEREQEPTHNYVIFDPKIVTILRKYGYLPAAVGAGAAAVDAVGRPTAAQAANKK